MKVLVFNPDLCDGQRGCEETCSQSWFKEVNPDKSAIRIAGTPSRSGGVDDLDRHGRFLANFCNQCGQCIDVCPTLALKRDRQGIVRIDKKLCVGCLSCVGFCPMLAMRALPDSTVPFKCVACGKCAKQCPRGALSIQEVPDAELTVTEKRLQGVA